MPSSRVPTAAVIGGVSWNLVVDVPELPTSTRTIVATGSMEGIGGTGAGKALNLARLGFDTRLHALVGEDAEGQWASRLLVDAGVDLHAWPDPRGTERHLNLMDPLGRRASIFVNPSSDSPDVSAEELLAFAAGADVVFVNLTEYARKVLPLLTEAGIPAWVDVHDWEGAGDFHRDFVEHARYLFISDELLADPVTRARELAETRELVVVTHGSRGATAVLPGQEPLFVPAVPVPDAVDSNGAGDAFAAGVAYGRTHGWDWPRSLRAGATVAAGCVAYPGLADPGLSPGWLTARA